MIKGIHAMFYSPQAAELRAFLRDKLDFSYSDAGDGWLIFDAPEAEIGCHPADKNAHDISFYCDDITETVARLKARGVTFTSDIDDREYGFVTRFLLPGDMEVELYQPKYQKTPSG